MDRDARSVRELEQFDEALQTAYDAVWWRSFIDLVGKRRAHFMEEICTRVDMEQRTEDRCRGQISELSFILLLDERARALRDGRRIDRAYVS